MIIILEMKKIEKQSKKKKQKNGEKNLKKME
jgi:hypothetical protein